MTTKTTKGTRINGFFSVVQTGASPRGCFGPQTPYIVLESLNTKERFTWWTTDESVIQIPEEKQVYIDAYSYGTGTLRRVTLRTEFNGREVTYPHKRS